MAKYKIFQLNDILEIPPESMDNFIEDLRFWYDSLRAIKTIADAVGDEQIKIAEGMLWVDDGKHGAHLHFNVLADDKTTGEG